MITHLWVLTCAGCGRTAYCNAPDLRSLSQVMQEQGWMLMTTSRTHPPEAECPDCAEAIPCRRPS